MKLIITQTVAEKNNGFQILFQKTVNFRIITRENFDIDLNGNRYFKSFLGAGL